MGVLSRLETLVTSDSVARCDSAKLDEVLAAVYEGHKVLEGIATRVGIRAQELAKSGEGRPVEDVMRSAGEVSAAQAKRQAARCELAVALPAVADAIDDGRARPENVDIIAKVRSQIKDDAHLKQFDAAQSRFAEKAGTLPPEVFRKDINKIVDQIRDDSGLERFEQQRKKTKLSIWVDKSSGMYKIFGEFDPERGAIIFGYIKSVAQKIAKRDNKSVDEQILAQGLFEICNENMSKASSSSGGARPSVSVICDLETLESGPHPDTVCELFDGSSLPVESVARMICDATITAIRTDNAGMPLSVGRSHRTATPAQRKALRVMYDSCAISGTTAFTDCEIHHVLPFKQGGNTDMDNLIPISKRWHHLVHEGKWKLEMLQDRTLKLYRPDGVLDRTVSPPIKSPTKSRMIKVNTKSEVSQPQLI